MNHAQDFDAVLVIHESCTWFWCCLSNTRIMHRLSQCWKRKLECKRIKFFLWLITGNQLLINNFSIAKHASSGLHCLPFFSFYEILSTRQSSYSNHSLYDFNIKLLVQLWVGLSHVSSALQFFFVHFTFRGKSLTLLSGWYRSLHFKETLVKTFCCISLNSSQDLCI
jgi:hypothetical protein